jgi:predicted HicB family RNase H-like nuclease
MMYVNLDTLADNDRAFVEGHPPPDRSSVHVRINTTMQKAIKAAAKRAGTSINDWICAAIDEKVNSDED